MAPYGKLGREKARRKLRIVPNQGVVRTNSKPIAKGMRVRELIDAGFQADSSARLREASQLFTEMMLEKDVTIGMSMTGALTPAGIGRSCLIPLIKAGFVDWIVGTPSVEDQVLCEIIQHQEFQRSMSTAEFHFLVGQFLFERERAPEAKKSCVLAVAYEYGVPIYASSPGDSSIGMRVAAMALGGNRLAFDIKADVNETASIVYAAKRANGKSGVFIVGGSSSKSFLLQTEPQAQEILGLDEKGHDFFLQITDTCSDTEGLPGGKADLSKLPDTVVCYCDATIALPLMTAYALDSRAPRKPKRLMDSRKKNLEQLQVEYLKRIREAEL